MHPYLAGMLLPGLGTLPARVCAPVGCRGFIGPVPPPLSIRSSVVAPIVPVGRRSRQPISPGPVRGPGCRTWVGEGGWPVGSRAAFRSPEPASQDGPFGTVSGQRRPPIVGWRRTGSHEQGGRHGDGRIGPRR